ncbi:DUF3159 domain-containing protein [Solihabitans fulvus]|uniref:DUF3159 domain-containing protein n=1 Tax=Solihabitans fulvus TaxID=1892852 RepID=A0A5B2XGT4_9PSEU|nr:DUF3159 domain-containing protein [Solihabitans fulvus]KAA2262384.1 DUF3159 domain-containing protein [Solihabitans fulvus]
MTEQPQRADVAPAGREESLAHLLGGRGGAVDATLPPAAFAVGWLLGGNSIGIGSAAAIGVGVLVGVVRLIRGERPRAVVVSVTLVVAAALVALHTGRAADFFLVQLLSNVASALLWAASIVIRWPLLGVVVGVVVGQKTRWRRDPDLLRAYGVASWAWVGQYVLRVAVYGALWLAGQTVALAVARVALTWPLQAACLAVSWWLIRRSLPADHPGLRHARLPADVPTDAPN